jgi:hypothetical protein
MMFDYRGIPLIASKNLCVYKRKRFIEMIAYFYIDKFFDWIFPDPKIYNIAGKLYAHPEICKKLKEQLNEK